MQNRANMHQDLRFFKYFLAIFRPHGTHRSTQVFSALSTQFTTVIHQYQNLFHLKSPLLTNLVQKEVLDKCAFCSQESVAFTGIKTYF
jgi:hypothetical protein